jgi:hypothetical protein
MLIYFRIWVILDLYSPVIIFVTPPDKELLYSLKAVLRGGGWYKNWLVVGKWEKELETS